MRVGPRPERSEPQHVVITPSKEMFAKVKNSCKKREMAKAPQKTVGLE